MNELPASPLPSCHAIERCVLSCFMQAPDLAAAGLMRTVKPEDFDIEAHGHLFRLLSAQMDAGAAVDLMTVAQLVQDHQLDVNLGGLAGLSDIFTAAANPADFDDYAREVKVKARARGIIQSCWKAVKTIQQQPTSDTVKDAAGALVDGILTSMADEQRVRIVPLREALYEATDDLEQTMANRGHVTGDRATGFTDLDRLFIKGLHLTENIVIAGDTSMGKTSLAVQIMENMATGTGHYREFYDYDVKHAHDWHVEVEAGRARCRYGKQACLLVCLESSQMEMASKMLLGRAGVNVKAIQSGMMAKEDLRLIGKASEALGSAPFWIWDAAGITVEELSAECKNFKLQHPELAVICVDHCGLLGARAVKDHGNETAVAGYVSSTLRNLYKQLNVVGLSLWQLNREAAAKGSRGQRPTRADLRSSGRIEQDATRVIMPFRPGHYKQDEDTDETEAYLIIAKNRGGAINLNGIPCRWDATCTRFLSEQKDEQGNWRPRHKLFSLREEDQQVR